MNVDFTDDFLNLPPPHSVEAEQAVLGCLFVQTDSILEVVDKLKADDFHKTPHQVIYSACLELFKQRCPIDIVSVSELLNDQGLLDSSGGRSYVNDLALSCITTESLPYHAQIVRNKAIARKLIIASFQLISEAHNQAGPSALEFGQRALLDIANYLNKQEEVAMVTLLKNTLGTIREEMLGIRKAGIHTGFSNLDKITHGLPQGSLILLGARPSMGKTAFALNICLNVALRQQKPVLFYSLEMSAEEVCKRLVLSESETTVYSAKMEEKAAEIVNSPLRIIDRPGIGIPQLRASVMRHRLEFGELGLICIDYLQLMKGDGENRVQEVSGLSRELKNLAREFNTPVLCLSQLSRAVESRQDKRPQLSDLRESGSQEQDADIVFFLYREEYYNKDARPGLTEVLIQKNRNGSVGAVEMNFRAAITKFY